MSFTEHPLRRWAVNEMRLRRFAPVPSQCDMYQVVRLIDKDARQAEDARLVGDKPDFDQWDLTARSANGSAPGGIQFLWERHTEASTLTLIFPAGTPADVRGIHVRWLEGWPGQVVRATRIFIEPTLADAERALEAMKLSMPDMVCCDVNAGLRLWSDFGILGDGYGRLLMTAGDIEPGERGRIVQRVQELGNYRNMALLGFPTVQDYGPTLDQLEARLSDHAKRVAVADTDDDSLLFELSAISSELELVRSATGFRLSATAAYADVAADRLNALDVRSVANFQSLREFTERRLVPAVRTCATFRARLDHVAERISRVMHTLDVRIDSRIKAQNLRLMQSMERSTQLQFRLQTLVEGLSVIAAAYYLIGLIAFVVKGVEAWPDGSPGAQLVGAITLPVVLIIYAFVHRLRTKVLRDAAAGQDSGPNHGKDG